MKFVDEITLQVKAGDGGNGVVRWMQEKAKPRGGPAGGNGGGGGDVYVRAVRDINVLSKYRGNTEFVAENGESGGRNSKHGKNGEALYINLPVGSIVTNTSSGASLELLTDGEEKKILSGGRGGYGNEHFKSSRNVRPTQWTAGKAGEEADFHIELALIADAGLIGLPNAGKSSLLNALTHAQAKVGAYQFTTLDPNLGAFYGFVLADIPGLIEGASAGKGLGHKFLKHITRTRTLIHCISLESEDVARDYTTVRKELEAYRPELLTKSELVVLTKSDMVSSDEIEKAQVALEEKVGGHAQVVSVLDDALLKEFSDTLSALLRKQ